MYESNKLNALPVGWQGEKCVCIHSDIEPFRSGEFI